MGTCISVEKSDHPPSSSDHHHNHTTPTTTAAQAAAGANRNAVTPPPPPPSAPASAAAAAAAPAAGATTAAPQAKFEAKKNQQENKKKNKVESSQEEEETSTVLREDLINLHARAKRRSVEDDGGATYYHTQSVVGAPRVMQCLEEVDAVSAAGAGTNAAASDAGAAATTAGGSAATTTTSSQQQQAPAPISSGNKKKSIGEMMKKPTEGAGLGYKRLKNVFAAPLNILADYTYPHIPKTANEKDFLLRCLSDNFIFSGLTEKECSLLLNAMERHHVHSEELIIKEGDIGDYFYVLQSGKVTFLINDHKVGQARKGGCFGELALLYDCPRAATARAETECTLFRVDQRTFRVMMANHKAQQNQENIKVLRKVEFFVNVDDSTLTKISDALTNVTFHKDDFIVRKGEVGKVFYIIKEGSVKISDIGGGEKRYVDQILSVGEFFGERALLTGEKRAANIKAVSDCKLLCLSKDTFENILGPLQDVIDNAMDRRKIQGVEIFANSNVQPFELRAMSNRFTLVTFEKGQTLVKENDDLSKFDNNRGLYFIKEGKITQTTESGAVNVLTKGDYFGERSILADTTKGIKAASSVVATETTICKFLHYKDIQRILGSLERLQEQTPQTSTGGKDGITNNLDSSVTMDVLTKHTILGAGTFGQVWLVSHKQTKDPYALKIQNKRELIKHGQVDGVIREKNLMSCIDHPFVIKLVNAYQDPCNLFMIMKLIQGGELFSVIHTETHDGVPEETAKFYAACVMEGLTYMHNRHILYRDLKPENVLIDKDGYCVLIDLGFAKVVTDKTYTLCGTPLYLAPEIILSRGYDKGVDHWSFGVLVYEMIIGFSPFYSHNIDQMTLFKRIVKVRYDFPSWASISIQAQDLIRKLLVLSQTDRLGSLRNGNYDIQNHVWLNMYKPDKLILKPSSIDVPWKPNITDPLDASNFEDWSHLDDKQSLDLKPPSEKEQKLFKKF